MVQIHKKLSDEQVKQLFKHYVNKKLERKYIQEILSIGKSRFFEFLKRYRKNPENFSIQYSRSKPTRHLDPEIEQNIFKELSEKKLIANKDLNIYGYNYSFIKDTLQDKYNQSVSLPAIISRAKAHGYYINKKRKKKVHDREVLTNRTDPTRLFTP